MHDGSHHFMRTTCARCGKLLWEAPDEGSVEHLCGDCGGQPPARHVTSEDSAKLHERAKLQERDDPRRAPVREVVVRDELTRDSRRWSGRRTETDKRNDVYKETVTDQETSAVICHKREKLSEHTRHSSDKNGRNKGGAA
jgi:hypothetical protein